MLNEITIMGRLIADPELKTTGNGITVCTFRIACDRDRVAEGGQKADFIDIVAWRQTGEFVNKYFFKGKPALIKGRLQIREWQDKEGKKRYTTEVLADSVYFCGGDVKQKEQKPAGPTQVPELEELSGDDSELPF